MNNDALWWTENILRISGSGPYTIEFNGWVRTIAPNLTIDHDNYRNYTFDPSFDYHVCGGLSESIGGRLRIQLEDGNCVDTQNPEVNLDGFEYLASNIFYLDENNLQSIDEWWYDGEPMVYSLQRSLFNDTTWAINVYVEAPGRVVAGWRHKKSGTEITNNTHNYGKNMP